MPKPYWIRDTDLITLEDGCVYFDTPHGALGPSNLREIADFLEETNKAWMDEVAKHLEVLIGEHGRVIDS